MSAIDEVYRQTQAGEPLGFEAWVGMVESRLRNSLRSYARQVDVEAIVQEGLLRMWVLARTLVLEGEDASLRYALRIVRNLAGHETRRVKRLGELAEQYPDSFPPDPNGPDDSADATADPFLRRAINDCISKLPERQRDALTARLNGAGADPDRALAEELGMRLNAFHQNIRRSRENLAVCLESSGVPVKELLGMTSQKIKKESLTIEAASTAFRERDVEGRLVASAAWWDLSPEGREAAFELQLVSRRLERAVDPGGLSTTGRAVLGRMKRMDQLE